MARYKANNYAQMKMVAVSADEGRYRYSRRLGTVEPVFADITHATGLKRFSLRGQRKVMRSG